MHTLRLRTLAAIGVAALVPIAAFLAFDRARRSERSGALAYASVSHSAGDARRVFAQEGVALRLRAESPTVVTLGNARDVLEVDAFGEPKAVRRTGFQDRMRGRPFSRACTSGALDAERWAGNIRVLVNCRLADDAAGAWLWRVDRALTRL